MSSLVWDSCACSVCGFRHAIAAVNERMKPGHPKVGATVEVTQLELQCNRQQFLGISYLHQWVTLHRYRPIASVAKDPRGWWDYAYQLATRKALQDFGHAVGST